MAELSSINFKKSFAINTEHNDRTLAPSYLIKKNAFECNTTAQHARTLKNEIINNAIQAYYSTSKARNKAFQAKNFEWSAVVNIKPETTMQDLEKLAKHFSDKYKFQCYQIAIHRDEGHINDKGKKVINHHAHLEFITLDKETGKQIFKMRDFTPQKMREIQSEVAEILGMQRGQDKRLSGAKRIEPRKYAQMKEQERANTRNLKAELDNTKQELTQERLTHAQTLKELEALRKTMAGQGFTKEQFAYINELKRQQKEKSAEPMTIEQIQELKKQIAQKSGFFSKKDKIIETLTEKLSTAEQDKAILNQIVSVLEQNQAKVKELIKEELENDNKRVLEELKIKERMAEDRINTYKELRERLNQSEISKELKEAHKAELNKKDEQIEDLQNDLNNEKQKNNELQIQNENEKNALKSKFESVMEILDIPKNSIIRKYIDKYHENKLKRVNDKDLDKDYMQAITIQYTPQIQQNNELIAKNKALTAENESLQGLKAENENLRKLNEFAMRMKEKAEQELKEVKEQLKKMTEAFKLAQNKLEKFFYQNTQKKQEKEKEVKHRSGFSR